MSERCRVSIMGKEASLGKATTMQKKQIKACKAKKRKATVKKVTSYDFVNISLGQFFGYLRSLKIKKHT